MRWRIYWLFPNHIRPPYGYDANYERQHDAEENTESRVPPELELRTNCVWGVELYGPAEIEGLYSGLRRLGWHTGMATGERDSALFWVSQHRAYGWGGWFNVGPVVRKDQRRRSVMVRNFAELPDGVGELKVTIHQLSPSLTAVLIGFRLEESLARRYEEELNRDRSTRRRRQPGFKGLMIVNPGNQKSEAVERVREQLREMVGQWFADQVPGYFSGLKRPTQFPTMELLTLAAGPILEEPPGEKPSGFFGWRRLLVNAPSHDAWTYVGQPGLQLTLDRYGGEHKGLHIVAALDVAAYPESSLTSLGGRTPGAYAYIGHELIGGVLLRMATVEYLKEHARYLGRSREALKRARSAHGHFKRTLSEIGRFFDRTLGSPPVMRELLKESKKKGWAYRHDCEKFVVPGWREGDPPIELSDQIRRRVRDLASRLAKDEDSIRAHFEQLSAILSVRESVKAQHRMEWLTVLAVVIASASLWVALPNKVKEPLWNRVATALHLYSSSPGPGGNPNTKSHRVGDQSGHRFSPKAGADRDQKEDVRRALLNSCASVAVPRQCEPPHL